MAGLQLMNREQNKQSLSPLIAGWTFLIQAIHFLMFKQVFSLGKEGVAAQRGMLTGSLAVSVLSWGHFILVSSWLMKRR